MWTPGNAQDRSLAFRKKIKAWVKQADQAIANYKVDLKKRLENFKEELKLIEEAHKFEYDFPNDLLTRGTTRRNNGRLPTQMRKDHGDKVKTSGMMATPNNTKAPRLPRKV